MPAFDPYALQSRQPAFLQWEEKGRQKFFYFDAVEAEHHDKSSELTSHSVEKGVDVTDHVIPQAIKVSLDVFITDTPIGYTDLYGESWGVVGPLRLEVPENKQPIGFSTGGLYQAAGNAVKSLFNKKPEHVATVFKPRNSRNFLQEAHTVLWRLIEDVVPITLTTVSRQYEDIYLVAAPMTRTSGKGGSANFSLEFQKLRVVTASTTRTPKELIAKPKISAPPKSPKQPRGQVSVGSDLLGYGGTLP